MNRDLHEAACGGSERQDLAGGAVADQRRRGERRRGLHTRAVALPLAGRGRGASPRRGSSAAAGGARGRPPRLAAPAGARAPSRPAAGRGEGASAPRCGALGGGREGACTLQTGGVSR